MATRTKLDRSAIAAGFQDLDRLSKVDYGIPLQQLVLHRGLSDEDKALRIGRLMGVSMKEPFSKSRKRPRPTRDTGSTRAWTLEPRLLVKSSHAHGTWQGSVLLALAKEDGVNPTALAKTLKRERNFFSRLKSTTHGYLCGDPKVRKAIEKNLRAVKLKGTVADLSNPGSAVGLAGIQLGTLLAIHVPVLGAAGATLIAGTVVLLYTIGMKAYCDGGEFSAEEAKAKGAAKSSKGAQSSGKKNKDQ